MASDPHRYSVPGLERGLRLLQLFDRTTTTLGASDIARSLAIPRSTVFRIVQTLEHLGYLERAGSVYRLGPAVLRLGFEYLASLELTDLARPIVERLRDQTGYPAQLVIRDGREVVVVLKTHGTSALTSTVGIGTRLPAHATTLGRVLLGDLGEAELRGLYPEARLESFGPATPKTASELARLVAADAARGFAATEGFFERGIASIVAPVRESGGRTIAAISVTLPAGTVDARMREELAVAVRDAAQALSHRLNYRPPQLGRSAKPIAQAA